MVKKLFIDSFIFIVLLTFPLFIFLFQIYSLTESQQQKKFLSEKLKIVSGKVDSEKPQVVEIVRPSDFANLIFADEIKVGDLLFYYAEGGFGFFIDKKTERIIGVGEQ